MRTNCRRLIVAILAFVVPVTAHAQNTRATPTYLRIKASIDQVPAIDTHDHLWPFDKLPGYRITADGKGMNLASIWQNSYLTWINRITPWQDGMAFDDWWREAFTWSPLP